MHSFDNISDYELRRIEEEEIKIHSGLYKLYNTETTCGSLYPNIKKAGIKHKDIALWFGYSNVEAFRTSSAHRRYMKGIETILILERNNRMFPIKIKAAKLINSIIDESKWKPDSFGVNNLNPITYKNL